MASNHSAPPFLQSYRWLANITFFISYFNKIIINYITTRTYPEIVWSSLLLPQWWIIDRKICLQTHEKWRHFTLTEGIGWHPSLRAVQMYTAPNVNIPHVFNLALISPIHVILTWTDFTHFHPSVHFLKVVSWSIKMKRLIKETERLKLNHGPTSTLL